MMVDRKVKERVWRIHWLVSVLMFLLGSGNSALAQEAGISVLQNTADVDFPRTVTFRLEIDSDQPVAGAQLIYQVGRDGCLAAGTHVPVEVDGPVLEWTWVMSRSGNPPPGAEMWWEWTISDPSGNVFTTPKRFLTFSDDRFEWRQIASADAGDSAPVTLNWYEGDDVGPVLLEAAVSGLERLESDTGIQLQGDVQIFVYGSAADMREALLYTQDWAGGLAFSEYNTILLGVPPQLAETWGSDTIRHEMAHLVLGQFGRSCLGGSRPTWLEEGLAVYAEGDPDEDMLQYIEEGIEEDSFQPVRSLNGSFPAEGEDANAAYSQSFSLVDFLLQTYGREKLQTLILELAAAEGYDQALERVYGFNTDGLEVAWREAIGAPSRQIPPTPTPVLARNVPTAVPLNAVVSVPTPAGQRPTPEADEGSDAQAEEGGGLCALSLAPFVVMLAMGAPIYLRKRNR